MRARIWNAAALGLAVVIASCGDDASDGANGGGTNEPDASQQHSRPPNHAGIEPPILFAPMYSAYIDDHHPCAVPAIVQGEYPGLRWQASDDSMVDLVENADGSVLITTKKAGTVEIIARTDSVASHSTLTITPFTLAEWEAGERRYNKDTGYVIPTMTAIMEAFQKAAMQEDGGAAWPLAFQPPTGTGCSSCHGDGASDIAVEYTPQQAGGFSDEDLVAFITTGAKTLRPSSLTSPIPRQVLEYLHSWDPPDIDEAQAGNIVAYMRSLPPKSVGPLDFGNRAQ